MLGLYYIFKSKFKGKEVGTGVKKKRRKKNKREGERGRKGEGSSILCSLPQCPHKQGLGQGEARHQEFNPGTAGTRAFWGVVGKKVDWKKKWYLIPGMDRGLEDLKW